jgi:hypothetical protein
MKHFHSSESIGRGLEMRSWALYDARLMIDLEDARSPLELAGVMLEELELRLSQLSKE